MCAKANVKLPNSHIYLLGFSGCGKSTIGPLLAEKLNRGFVDTDAVVEKKRRRTIRWIFENEGEAAFRKMETEVIARIASSKRPSVVALGGGVVTVPRNRHVIKSSGISVFLSCSIRVLERRLRPAQDRPLLELSREGPVGSPVATRQTAITNLLARRRPLYRQADITVATTNHTPRQVADEIVDRLRRKYANR